MASGIRRNLTTEAGAILRSEDGRPLTTEGRRAPYTPYIETPILVIVRRNDPDFDRLKRKVLEYDFAPEGRRFYANPAGRGAYGYQFNDQFNQQFGGISGRTTQFDEGEDY